MIGLVVIVFHYVINLRQLTTCKKCLTLVRLVTGNRTIYSQVTPFSYYEPISFNFVAGSDRVILALCRVLLAALRIFWVSLTDHQRGGDLTIQPLNLLGDDDTRDP